MPTFSSFDMFFPWILYRVGTRFRRTRGFCYFWTLYRKSDKILNYECKFSYLALEGAYEVRTLSLHFYQIHSKCATVWCIPWPHLFFCPWIPFPCPSSLIHSLPRYLIECLLWAEHCTRCWVYSDIFAEVPSSTQPFNIPVLQDSVIHLLLFLVLGF